MWNKVSLPIKITVPLVLMQVLGLVLGGWILMAKIDEARLKEMDELLKGQSELIAESLLHNVIPLDVPVKSELFRDLEKDSRIYFQLTDPEGQLIFASIGQGKDKRAELAGQLSQKHKPLDFPYNLSHSTEKWRAIRTQIKYPSGGIPLTLTLHTALNETASIAELDNIRTRIVAGAFFLGLLTTIATVAIVLLSTVNLRLFARNLGKIDPENPKWSFPIRARSAEEILLFTSFDKMMQEMVKARQTQKLFLANASHELKTPVAGMMAALEVLLARERSVADFQAICRELLRTVRDMKRLTGALLDHSLLDGQKSMALQTTDVREIVSRALERWLNLARTKGVRIQWHQPNRPLQLLAHPELLDVAISNLIDNAIKYSPENGKVSLELKETAQKIILKISDEGIGMSPETQARLGEVFYRADAARSVRDSFGLGFANAKRILESHKAKLHVTSSPGKGTSLQIEFDRA